MISRIAWTCIIVLIFLGRLNAQCTSDAGFDFEICDGAEMVLQGVEPNGVAEEDPYLWTQISGPSAIILNPHELSTPVQYQNDDIIGNLYVFQLKTKCKDGSFSLDVVEVYVGTDPVNFLGIISNEVNCTRYILTPEFKDEIDQNPNIRVSWERIVDVPERSVLYSSFQELNNELLIERKPGTPRNFGGFAPDGMSAEEFFCHDTRIRMTIHNGGCKASEEISLMFGMTQTPVRIYDHATNICNNNIFLRASFAGCRDGDFSLWRVIPLDNQGSQSFSISTPDNHETTISFSETGLYRIEYDFYSDCMGFGGTESTQVNVFQLENDLEMDIDWNFPRLECDRNNLPQIHELLITHNPGLEVEIFNLQVDGRRDFDIATINKISDVQTLISIDVLSSYPDYGELRVDLHGSMPGEPCVIIGQVIAYVNDEAEITVDDPFHLFCDNSVNLPDLYDVNIPFSRGELRIEGPDDYHLNGATIPLTPFGNQPLTDLTPGNYTLYFYLERSDFSTGTICISELELDMIVHASLPGIAAGSDLKICAGEVASPTGALGDIDLTLPGVTVEWRQIDQNDPLIIDQTDILRPLVTNIQPGSTYELEFIITLPGDDCFVSDVMIIEGLLDCSCFDFDDIDFVFGSCDEDGFRETKAVWKSTGETINQDEQYSFLWQNVSSDPESNPILIQSGTTAVFELSVEGDQCHSVPVDIPLCCDDIESIEVRIGDCIGDLVEVCVVNQDGVKLDPKYASVFSWRTRNGLVIDFENPVFLPSNQSVKLEIRMKDGCSFFALFETKSCCPPMHAWCDITEGGKVNIHWQNGLGLGLAFVEILYNDPFCHCDSEGELIRKTYYPRSNPFTVPTDLGPCFSWRIGYYCAGEQKIEKVYTKKHCISDCFEQRPPKLIDFEYTISPNPFNHTTKIASVESLRDTEISIYGVAGNLIKTVLITEDIKEFTIDDLGLNQGHIYFVKMSNPIKGWHSYDKIYHMD